MGDQWPDVDDADDGLWGNVQVPQPKSMAPAYQPSFTHPATPQTGFTHNFGEPELLNGSSQAPYGTPVIVIDDDGASGSSQATATLVCARCLDPMVLPSEESSADENKQRRIWALRCGHMLDGKCIAELMRPHVEVSQVKFDHDTSSDSHSADPQSGKEDGWPTLPRAIPDYKGKGKAVDRGVPGRGDQGDMSLRPMESLDNESIRSRLRPRRNAAPLASDDVDMEEDEGEPYSERPMRPLPRRARGASAMTRPKGKARKRNERYHWKCPVAECGHDHVSILAPGDNEYRMDPHKGAVALFL